MQVLVLPIHLSVFTICNVVKQHNTELHFVLCLPTQLSYIVVFYINEVEIHYCINLSYNDLTINS